MVASAKAQIDYYVDCYECRWQPGSGHRLEEAVKLVNSHNLLFHPEVPEVKL
jgi:hypothetical protein